MTTGELALLLDLRLRGEAARVLHGAAALEDATGQHLSFAGGPKFYDVALRSSAGCLIAPADYPGAESQSILESPRPRAHFAQALALLYPEPPLQPGIHPTAVLGPGAEVDPSAEIGAFAVLGQRARIGARTLIGPGSVIGARVQVGEDSRFHPRVSVYPGVTFGPRCVIHSGAVIGADGFGFEMVAGAYRKVPQVGTVEIGSDVEIGANCCIDRATLGATVIGSGTKLDNQVHIAHNCRIGRNVVIAAQTGLAGGVTIGDGAIIGGQVGMGDKARVEPGAIVGSGAGILTSKIVRAGEPVWGTPARPLRQYLGQLAAMSRLSKKQKGN